MSRRVMISFNLALYSFCIGDSFDLCWSVRLSPLGNGSRDLVCLMAFDLDFFVVDAAANAWSAVGLEVLAQPRDAAGLPQGPPIVLDKQTIKLRRSHDRQRLLCGCRLPTSIRPQLARECYYRIVSERTT